MRSAIICLFCITGLLGCRPVDQSAELVAKRRAAGCAVINLAGEPSTLDPARGTRLDDLRVIGQLLEGLVKIGENGALEPAAAESWEVSDDQRTWRFRLRPAKWSKGDPVRAGDFAFAWRRVLDPATRAYWASLLFAIDGARKYYEADEAERAATPLGIDAPDDRTLVVRLQRPVPYFLSLLALEAYYPVHAKSVELLGEGAFRAPDFVGNGPFRLAEHLPRQRIVLEVNEHYRERMANGLEKVVFTIVENEFTEWTAYRRGEIDVTASVHRSALDSVRETPDFRVAPMVGTSYIAFNCAKPPFDRPEARRAFARALDRRQLVDYITRSGESPATGFVPPGIPGAAEGSDFRSEAPNLLSPTSPDKADLASLCKVAASLSPKPVYSFDANELQRSLAVALQMMWHENLGADVEIQSYPSRLIAQSKRDGEFMMARASWVADYLDAMTFLDVFRSDGPNNTTGWKSARYDTLLDRADAATDRTVRNRLLHDAERLLLDEMPICPLYFYSIAYLQRPGLEGVLRNPLGRIDLARAHWTTAESR